MSLVLSPRFPEAVSPTAWGAAVDYDTKAWRPWVPDKWVLHWGGTPVSSGAAAGDTAAERAQLRSWENYHKNTLGWLGIAYNWAIGNSGTLYRLRGDNRSGATAGDAEPDGVPENHEAVAVVFIVGARQTVSTAALDTFRGMYRDVPELATVTGHKFVAAGPGYGTVTTCPGPQLSEFITTQSYLPDEGDNMGVSYPVDADAHPNDIRFMQNLLNSAFNAGLVVNGVWDAATSAAIAEHLDIPDAPPFKGSGILRLHRWTIREFIKDEMAGSGDWQEARVAALESHSHHTGPPQ